MDHLDQYGLTPVGAGHNSTISNRIGIEGFVFNTKGESQQDIGAAANAVSRSAALVVPDLDLRVERNQGEVELFERFIFLRNDEEIFADLGH